jgi:aerobic carbon-monoxide dehydrogenase large subunit
MRASAFRGGVVQGFGIALFETCIQDERGQLINADMVDYLLPMSGEMPDIDIDHVISPTFETELGAKGGAAVADAMNDALRPFGAMITGIALTPQIILTALRRI